MFHRWSQNFSYGLAATIYREAVSTTKKSSVVYVPKNLCLVRRIYRMPFDMANAEFANRARKLVEFLVVGNTNNEIRYYIALHIKCEKLDSYSVKFEQSIFSLLF